MKTPNHRDALQAGRAICLSLERQWSGAGNRERSVGK
jgi:hypothetical protein